jgi:hypothetical protein
MSKSKYLNKTFQIILDSFIATGQAPNYEEVATELGISPSEGRKVFRKLISSLSFPGWFQPKTDNIASFAPFNNLPNNYKLTIEGEQKWFGQ